MGLALALPRLAQRLPPRGLMVLLTGVGAIGAIDLVCNMLVARGAMASVSLGGPALLACFGVVIGALSGDRMGWRGARVGERASIGQ